MPSIDDVIVGVSTAWTPATMGIVRLSGRACCALVESLGAIRPETNGRATRRPARIAIEPGVSLPADVVWFFSPRSYTGQDLVEIHIAGCLPLLRCLCDRLIEAGARRAFPGEFSARAFLNGKLNATQVDGVLGLISAQNADAVRTAARLARGGGQVAIAALREQLAETIALLEAGIDFADEEGISLISSAQLRSRIEQMCGVLSEYQREEAILATGERPHVALVGLPNAGKSTLFNALLGHERAIVSPVVGTTRDVLSAEIEMDGVQLVLQDCAGLGETADELELATHLASERAADQADIVLWMHDCALPWDRQETEAVSRISEARRILVWSKCDEPHDPMAACPVTTAAEVSLSAASGTGLDALRTEIVKRLAAIRRCGTSSIEIRSHADVMAAMRRALALLTPEGMLESPELVALELRMALESILPIESASVVENVLGRIFSQFCIGK